MKPKAKASRHRSVRWAALLVIWIGAPPSHADQESYRFPYPANRLGWADGSGKLSIWVDDDWKVDLGNGETLPLRFHFSSMQDRISDGLLGVGWWVPLLESTVVQQSETRIRMTALGGQSVYFYRSGSSGKGDVYLSKDGMWEGFDNLNGQFSATGPDAWRFEYDKGRIKLARSPNGKDLRWTYMSISGRSDAIVDAEGRELLAVRLHEDGFIKELLVKDSFRLVLNYEDIPLLGEAAGHTAVRNVKPSLSEVKVLPVNEDSEHKRKQSTNHKFRIELKEGDANSIEHLYRMEFEGPKGREKFTWRPDGRILDDSNGYYGYDRTDGGYRLERFLNNGTNEIYSWDSKNFTQLKTTGGREEKKYYIGNGKNYMKERKVEITDPLFGVYTKNYHYSDHGDLLKSVFKHADCSAVWSEVAGTKINSPNGKVYDFQDKIKVVFSNELNRLLWLDIRGNEIDMIPPPLVKNEIFPTRNPN